MKCHWRSFIMSELKKSTRTSFAEAIVEVGEKNPDVVTVAADSASRYGDFIKSFRKGALMLA